MPYTPSDCMKSKKRRIRTVSITPAFLLASLLIISLSLAQSISSANYKIPRESIDWGGGNFSSADYFLEASTEPIGGNGSSANYAICIGLNCCPADILVRFANSTINDTASTATIAYALFQSDVCMGITNVTVECAANCNPCSQACTTSVTRYTLSLTDIITGSNTMSISNPNITTPIYCRATDDTFQLETCFNSPQNLTVTIEAGGPYTSNSPTVLVAGNVTNSDGTVVSGANVTIDVYRKDDLFNRQGRVTMLSSSEGRYFATFAGLAINSYQVNATATYESLRANATDTFDIVNIHGNCNVRTITLSGRALDATTGLKIDSGTAILTIRETGDTDSAAFTNGVWTVDIVTCIVPYQKYTAAVKIVDTTGKVSWSELQFTAP